MCNMKTSFSLIIKVLLVIKIKGEILYNDKPRLRFSPCITNINNPGITSEYEYDELSNGEVNNYILRITYYHPLWLFINQTNIILEFDSDVQVSFVQNTGSTISGMSMITPRKLLSYFHKLDENLNYIQYMVKGGEAIPYLKSVIIDEVEFCETPIVGYLDKIAKDYKMLKEVRALMPNNHCGKRKIDINELIVGGQSSKPGHWPWHVAIYRAEGASNTYICGGTLISKHFVLTAAHCATVNRVAVVPDILSVHLGKYHLRGGDTSTEERDVMAVIIHEEFYSPMRSDNDIALLKLKTEAVYTDYIQPACIWSSKAPASQYRRNNQLSGTVVGWGALRTYDHNLSTRLLQVSLPMISDEKCMKKDPIFYGTMLINERKFCAGWTNGTSPCNGDSGGGFMVNMPDASGAAGVWYIRGIVSVSKTIPIMNTCDPEQYVIFTDTSKYEDWIRDKIYGNYCNCNCERKAHQ